MNEDANVEELKQNETNFQLNDRLLRIYTFTTVFVGKSEIRIEIVNSH